MIMFWLACPIHHQTRKQNSHTKMGIFLKHRTIKFSISQSILKRYMFFVKKINHTFHILQQRQEMFHKINYLEALKSSVTQV